MPQHPQTPHQSSARPRRPPSPSRVLLGILHLPAPQLPRHGGRPRRAPTRAARRPRAHRRQARGRPARRREPRRGPAEGTDPCKLALGGGPPGGHHAGRQLRAALAADAMAVGTHRQRRDGTRRFVGALGHGTVTRRVVLRTALQHRPGEDFLPVDARRDPRRVELGGARLAHQVSAGRGLSMRPSPGRVAGHPTTPAAARLGAHLRTAAYCGFCIIRSHHVRYSAALKRYCARDTLSKTTTTSQATHERHCEDPEPGKCRSSERLSGERGRVASEGARGAGLERKHGHGRPRGAGGAARERTWEEGRPGRQ